MHMMTQARRTGQRIKQLREDRGWTRERMVREALEHPQVGAEWPISEASIWRAESGRLMSTKTRYPIAVVLGLSPSDLWPPSVLDTSRRRPPTQKELAA
jgi:transcriptional regulator with XRE-family HTH domain